MRKSLHLLYHELTAHPTTYGYALATEVFRNHLSIVQAARVDLNLLHPVVTFDDGHVSNLTLALPQLQHFAISGHFFITAGWTSVRAGYMDRRQLLELHRLGHTIGAHGWSHKLLTHCSDQELQVELVQARAHLEHLLSAEVRTLSLPGGRYDRRVLQACREAGYTQIFTSEPAAASPDAPLIGRVNLRSDASAQALHRLLSPDSGALRSLSRTYSLKQFGQRLLGDAAYARLWGVLNRAAAQPGDNTLA